MIELHNVTRRYQSGDTEVLALEDVSMRVNDGDSVAIVGPSGSGKSTLLQIVGLLDLPSDGRVILDGRDVSTLGEAERSRLRLTSVGFIFQRFHLISLLTALENVALPMEELGISLAERYDRARDLLTQVGLGDRLDFPPSRLSGGQRQRVAICRAVANRPKLVLADEPTGELHSEDKARILELFHRLNNEGNTFVVVTHDEETAAAANHRIELRDGRVYRTSSG